MFEKIKAWIKRKRETAREQQAADRLIKHIEQALGFELYEWQRLYIITGIWQPPEGRLHDFNPRSPQRERQQFLPILSLCFYATITCFHFFSPFSLPKFIIVVFKLYIFVHFFRCESTAFFMCNYGSHLQN